MAEDLRFVALYLPFCLAPLIMTALLGDLDLDRPGGLFALHMGAASSLLLVGMVYALYRQHVRLLVVLSQLDQVARTDELTGLGNRRAFWELAEQETKRALRQGLPASLFVIDLDRFKAVNDTLGHVRGDQLLCAVASALQESTREDQDRVFRIGGDEFAVILPGTDAAAAWTVAERVVSGTAQAFAELPTGLAGLSVGVATLGLTEDLGAWIDRADGAMYQAKASGGGRAAATPVPEAPPAVRLVD